MFVVWVSGNDFRCAARTLTQAIRYVPTQAKTGREWATPQSSTSPLKPKPGLEWATRPCGVSQKIKQKGTHPLHKRKGWALKPDSLLGLGNDAQVRLRRLPAARILLLGFVVGDATADDDVVAGLPVHRGGD